MVHVGVSGWSFLFVEMEAYGAAASKQFCCKAREEPGLKSCDHQHRVQLARSDRGGF